MNPNADAGRGALTAFWIILAGSVPGWIYLWATAESHSFGAIVGIAILGIMWTGVVMVIVFVAAIVVGLFRVATRGGGPR